MKSNQAIESFAREHDININALLAVSEVESKGQLLKNGKLVILFERHIFYRELRTFFLETKVEFFEERFNEKYREFSRLDIVFDLMEHKFIGKRNYKRLKSREIVPLSALKDMFVFAECGREAVEVVSDVKVCYNLPLKKYGTYYEQERRLSKAILIDEELAYRSISMGGFQILGRNFILAGFNSATEMYESFLSDENSQIEAFLNFLSDGMIQALRDLNWKVFARLYNGSGYRKNKYDTKLEKAFLRLRGSLQTKT